MAVLREEQVEVELRAQPLVELQRRVVEARALRRLVVGAQDRRVAPGGARADVALLEHRHVADPVVLGEVVRGGEAVRAAADDHDVVGVLELAAPAPHAAGAEEVTHAASRERLPSGSSASSPRAAAEARGGVGHHGPHVAAERRAEQHQVAVLALAQDRAGRARHRAGAEAVHGRRLRAQVDRGEAREQLAGERSGDVSAAQAVVTSITLAGPAAAAASSSRARSAPARRARRGRARASACTGTTRRRPRAGGPAELQRPGDPREVAGSAWSSILPRCERSAKPTAARQRCARLRAVEAHGHVPAVAQLEPRAGGERLALHRAARERRRRDGERNSRLTSAAPRRRGRRTARVTTVRLAAAGPRRRS